MKLIPILCVLVTALPVVAKEVSVFQMESAVAYALKRNPDLIAARKQIDEARGRRLQSGRMANPDLEAEFRHTPDFREGALSVGFTQKFPVTARLSMEKAVGAAGVRAAEAEVENAARLLRTEVRTVCVKILSVSDQKTLRERQLAAGTEQAKVEAQRVEKGEGSSLDVAQYELETQRIKLELLQLSAEHEALLTEFRPLLGLAVDASVSLNGELPNPRQDTAAQPFLENRPDYRAALANEDAARSAWGVEVARQRPDITAGVFIEGTRTEDAPKGLTNDAFIGFKFIIPLPYRDKNEGAIQQAHATVLRKEAERDALASRIHAEAAEAVAAMKSQVRIITNAENELLPQAVELEQKLRTAYEAGQGTLQDVFKARSQRLMLEETRLQALRNYHLARVRLLAATSH